MGKSFKEILIDGLAMGVGLIVGDAFIKKANLNDDLAKIAVHTTSVFACLKAIDIIKDSAKEEEPESRTFQDKINTEREINQRIGRSL